LEELMQELSSVTLTGIPEKSRDTLAGHYLKQSLELAQADTSTPLSTGCLNQ